MREVPEGTSGAVPVTRTWLQVTDAAEIVAGRTPDPIPHLEVVTGTAWWMAQFFYRNVGADWSWVDRLGWSEARWRQWTEAPGYELHWFTIDGLPGGYAEIIPSPEGPDAVEVAYFGLMPHAIGRGLGGWFLAYALRTAFARSGTQRVHLNTCTTDGPNAMANYRARGLTPYREAVEWRLPESPLP